MVTVCPSKASCMAARSSGDILSSSSIARVPLCASTKAPASREKPCKNSSRTTEAVKPAPLTPFPEIKRPFGDTFEILFSSIDRRASHLLSSLGPSSQGAYRPVGPPHQGEQEATCRDRYYGSHKWASFRRLGAEAKGWLKSQQLLQPLAVEPHHYLSVDHRHGRGHYPQSHQLIHGLRTGNYILLHEGNAFLRKKLLLHAAEGSGVASGVQDHLLRHVILLS